jgi:hypothetical protein
MLLPANGNMIMENIQRVTFTYTKTGIVNLNIAADTVLNISEDSAKNYNINLLKWVYNYSAWLFWNLLG